MAHLAAVEPTKLTAKPTPQSWSALEVVAHLVTAERLSIQYIRKKKQGIATLGNTGPWEEFKFFLLKVSQRIGFRYRAPKAVVASTPAFASLEQAREAWAHQRGELKKLLDEFSEQDVRKKIFKHPFAGRLNILQTVTFFGEHVRHHQPQIDRLVT
ncbi:MAG: DinB family protein [Cyclobacteriaceae bacterium]|nr:DinB family protein [Cyclobacteriaceae bacterium]